MTRESHPAKMTETKIEQYRNHRTVDTIIALFNPTVAQQFDSAQWQEIRRIVDLAMAKPSPKIIDLRFTVDLMISRFYFTLFVGKDFRRQSRKKGTGSRIANFIAAVCLLFGLNLLLSASVVVILYLIKSAVGINLMPGHFSDLLADLL